MKSRLPILVVFLLAVVAIVAGTWYTQRGSNGVSGPVPDPVTAPTVTVRMVYSTEKKDWIEAAKVGFATEHPEIALDLVPMGSFDAAEGILDGKLTPTVFSPADSLVLRLFASDWEAKAHTSPFVDGTTPEPLLITPLVFAVWEDRGKLLAEKGGGHMSWKEIRDVIVDKRGWPALGGPSEWGFVKLGHTDPTRSNSGLQAIALMAMDYHGRNTLTVADVLDTGFQTWFSEIELGVSRFEDSTGTFMTDMVRFGPSKYDLSVVYESTAVAQIENAQGRWGSLRVYYPATTLWSDHPVALLAQGATDAEIAAAKVWVAYLRSRPVQERALAYGFRPGDPSVPIRTEDPNNPFVKYAAYGVQTEIPPVAPPPDAPVVRSLMTLWSRTVPRR